ncbi:uncharacterized protein N7515_001164 [Penicillium bovifimosum]|uniref:Uncharacterized protein n=1 Tax=Penicillium bovifimosum TaxID=126998 RepID=A0A9W9HGP3_9EURO|nr:uncharacterized protein N7515_001164 [Penicillium bovifimosum]KAJ5146600.1 hypothetical protein N7515_001164 [Penicillium bovifimosum]
MAPPLDYEPSIAPAAFAAGWRQKFRSQPQRVPSTYSLPNDDCPFEYVDQPLNTEANDVTGNEVDRQRIESDNLTADSSSLALPDLDNLRQHSPEVIMALGGTFIRQAMDEQIRQQDVWNDGIQRQMEAIVEHYRKIDALEAQVAALQAKLDVLCGDKEAANAGRRSGGRRRQAP